MGMGKAAQTAFQMIKDDADSKARKSGYKFATDYNMTTGDIKYGPKMDGSSKSNTKTRSGAAPTKTSSGSAPKKASPGKRVRSGLGGQSATSQRTLLGN